jgi:transcriptional activator SPT8
LTSPSPRAASVPGAGLPFRPSVRAEALTAPVYDIVPTIAAPHSTSINAITATPDMRWVFSGGADGYIRKFNWVDTANFKLALTVAQRHPFVDSVTKAGVLMSYWENEEGINDYPFRLISWCANTSCRPKHDG